jgi:molecular chaperone HscB
VAVGRALQFKLPFFISAAPFSLKAVFLNFGEWVGLFATLAKSFPLYLFNAMSDTFFDNVDIKSLSANYFELLNFPVAFDIDKKALRNRYKALLSVCHPDRFVSKSKAEESVAVLATAHVTQAFNTLKSPPKRAAYLLELLGCAVNFNANLSTDPHFLMEQLELRESLETVSQGDESDLQIQTLIAQAASLESKEGEAFQSLYKQLCSFSEAENRESLFQKAQDSVLKLRFLEKLFDEIDALQHKLLD